MYLNDRFSSVECILSRRDSTIVARHEVPGLQRGPVPKRRSKSLSVPQLRSVQSSRWDEAIFLTTQALRAWLLSSCPSGTKPGYYQPVPPGLLSCFPSGAKYMMEIMAAQEKQLEVDATLRWCRMPEPETLEPLWFEDGCLTIQAKNATSCVVL
jgi:hypothetical protein